MDRLPLHLRMINKFSLRQIIVIPIIAVVIFAASIIYIQVSQFVYKYSENIVTNNQIQIENQIRKELDNYFEIPEYINTLNATLSQNGQLDIKDEVNLGKVFLKEALSHPTVDYVYFANEKGGIVSSGIHKGTYRMSFTEGMKQGDFKVHEVDENGNKMKYIKSIRDFDPRIRSWYKEAKDKGDPYWTEVYSGAQEPILGISTSYPLTSSNGEKLGVFGTDILLSQISSFLENLRISENGMVYLFEPNGLVVATSTDEPPFIYENREEERLSIENSSNIVIREGYKIFTKEMDMGNKQMKSIRKQSTILGDDYYYNISEYSHKDKVVWYILIAIPKRDFWGDVESLFTNFKIIFGVVLFITLLLGIYVSNWIVKPIKTLNYRVGEIKNNNWGVQIDTYRRDALGELTRSFNEMSSQLREYFIQLSDKQEELEYMNMNLEEIVEERTKKLELLSNTDELTSIFNRRYLIETLEESMKRAKKNNESLSIMILDIDHFKRVNDNYGHVYGDETLIILSNCLKNAIREIDILGRYGGEEFMIVLPKTHVEDAFKIAERIRKVISNLSIGKMNIRITISGGVAQYGGESLMEFINRADKNLYRAKEDGRNRIEK